jgi:hypothetical protein
MTPAGPAGDALKHGWLSTNWGNIASVIGVVISVFTLRSARKASRAAEEAKQYILIRTMSQDLSHAEQLAADIYAALKGSNHDAAGMRCRDLNDLVQRFSARWASQLSEQSRNNMLRAREKLTGLERGFEKMLDPSDQDKTVRLLRVSREVTKIFVEERAGLEGSLDSNGKQN